MSDEESRAMLERWRGGVDAQLAQLSIFYQSMSAKMEAHQSSVHKDVDELKKEISSWKSENAVLKVKLGVILTIAGFLSSGLSALIVGLFVKR